MNILQINKFHYLKGGADRHYLELSKLLESKNHHIINFSTKSEKNIPNNYSKYWPQYYDLRNIPKVKILATLIKFFYNYEAIRGLKKLLKNNKVDIAHIHNIYHHLTPGILKVLRDNKIPIVMTIHDYKLICPHYTLFNNRENKICEQCHQGNYFNCVKNRCTQNSFFKSLISTLEMYFQKIFFPYNKLVDVFIAPSEFMKNKLSEFGFKNKNIKILYNFQNLKKISDEKIDNYFVFFGRLVKPKGLDNFIKVLSQINKNYKFKIIGKGEEKDDLKKLVKELNLESKIEFLGHFGKNQQLEMKKIIKKSKFVVVPSIWYENCSLSILEAMSFSKPVLTSNLGGNPELIKNDYNGFLYSSNDELLEKLNYLIDIEDLSDLTENFRRDIKNKFNKEKYYEKIMKIYQSLVK